MGFGDLGLDLMRFGFRFYGICCVNGIEKSCLSLFRIGVKGFCNGGGDGDGGVEVVGDGWF